MKQRYRMNREAWDAVTMRNSKSALTESTIDNIVRLFKDLAPERASFIAFPTGASICMLHLNEVDDSDMLFKWKLKQGATDDNRVIAEKYLAAHVGVNWAKDCIVVLPLRLKGPYTSLILLETASWTAFYVDPVADGRYEKWQSIVTDWIRRSERQPIVSSLVPPAVVSTIHRDQVVSRLHKVVFVPYVDSSKRTADNLRWVSVAPTYVLPHAQRSRSASIVLYYVYRCFVYAPTEFNVLGAVSAEVVNVSRFLEGWQGFLRQLLSTLVDQRINVLEEDVL